MTKKSTQIQNKKNEVKSTKIVKMAKSFGHIDYIQNGAIFGWCYSGVNGKFEIVEFRVGSVHVGSAIADQYREDLDRAGYNSGACAFVWKIPAEYLNQDEDSVISAYADNGEQLQNSPVVLHGTYYDEEYHAIPVNIKSDINQINLYNLFDSVSFKPNLNSKKRVLTQGDNISEGWSINASTKDIGSIFYWIGIAELFGSELVEPLIRIHAQKPVGLVRVFGKFKKPNIYFVRPLVLYFHIGNKDKISTAIIKIRLMIKGADGVLRSLFSVSISQFPSTQKDFSLNIPADVINSISMDSIDDASVVFEFVGNINIELGRFKFSAGRNYNNKNILISDGFEDLNIENQYQTIRGYFRNDVDGAIDLDGQIKWKALSNQILPEIVIPIFDELPYVEKCLDSVINTVDFPHLVTLVDDGSSKETAVWLDKFAIDKPWVKVLRNQSNIGYTRAINRAIRESTGTAIVLLNSDTVVCSRWLEKLISVAESDKRIGLVGPLSNAASWQSVPRVKDQDDKWEVNNIYQDISLEDFARKIECIGAQNYPSVPVLNGFCLYIKRSVIESIGLFDEATFPHGYGEENDFCFRAIDAGFELRVAIDAYVYHAKTKSFSTERRSELSDKANLILQERYGNARLEDIACKFAAIDELNLIRQQLILDEGIPNG